MSEQQQRLRILNKEIVTLNKEKEAFIFQNDELSQKELKEIDEVLNSCFDEKGVDLKIVFESRGRKSKGTLLALLKPRSKKTEGYFEKLFG